MPKASRARPARALSEVKAAQAASGIDADQGAAAARRANIGRMTTSPGHGSAMKTKHPYAVPAGLSPDLARVMAYWRGLLRGSAAMPFWDDAKLSDLPDLEDRMFLIDVFDQPDRYRFGVVGQALGGDGLAGRFLDETDLARPFEFLASQCAATVECAEPTYLRHPASGAPYSRLLLPMWGDGRISMLLGIVEG
jgi:hypothetical protein